jgi:hypothetical protein
VSQRQGPAVEPGLRVAAGVVALEAVALLGVGTVELVSLNSSRVGLGVTTAVFFLACAFGLGIAARGLSRAQSWSRGPVVAAQLLVLGVAWSTRSTPVVAVPLAVCGLAVLVLVLRRASTEALSE